MRSQSPIFAAVFLLSGIIAAPVLAQSNLSESSSNGAPVFSLASSDDADANPVDASTQVEVAENAGDEGNVDQGTDDDNGDPQADVEGKQVFHALMALTSDDPIDGATAITILIVGSFVVYRISTFIVWLVTMTWPKLIPNPENIPAEQFLKREMAMHAPMRLYYLIAALVALVLQVAFCEIQLLGALGFETKYPMLDCIFTAGIMVVGAKRVAQWLDLPAIPGDPDHSKPVEVTGEVVLRDPVNT